MQKFALKLYHLNIVSRYIRFWVISTARLGVGDGQGCIAAPCWLRSRAARVVDTTYSLFRRDTKIVPLPAVAFFPKERKIDSGPGSDRGGQIDRVHVQSRISGVGIVVRLPPVSASMHNCRCEHFDA